MTIGFRQLSSRSATGSSWRSVRPGTSTMSGIEGVEMMEGGRRKKKSHRKSTPKRKGPAMARKKSRGRKHRRSARRTARRRSYKRRYHTKRRYSRRAARGGRRFTVTGIHRATLMGDPGKIDGPVSLLTNLLAFGVGLVGGSLLGGKIPAPERLKPAIPLAIGVGGAMLPQVRSLPFAKPILMGMAGAGLLSYGKMIAPNLPYLTGEVPDMLGVPAELTGEEAELMGAIAEQQLLGQDDDLGDDDAELSGDRSFVTSASL